MQVIQYACRWNGRRYETRPPWPECGMESREYLSGFLWVACNAKAHDVPGWPFPAKAVCSRPAGHIGAHLCQVRGSGRVYARWYDRE